MKGKTHMLELKVWFLCTILASLSNTGVVVGWSLPNFVDHYVSIDTNASVFTVNERFLSVAIDSNIIREHWAGLNFSSERLFTVAKALSPSYIRFGGTAEDFLIYGGSNVRTTVNRGETVQVVEYLNAFKNETNFTFSSTDLDKIHFIAQKSGLDVLFGLNVLLREHDGTWNASNAKMILDYVTGNGYQFGWELGNEPNHFSKFNRSLSAEQLADDFVVLKNILQDYAKFGKQFIVGPDITRPNPNSLKYLAEFLSKVENLLDAVTWHQYYVDGRTCSQEDFYNPHVLDYLLTQIYACNNILAPGTRRWLGETSSAWGGGAPGLSDRYVAGFMWLDKLGLSARLGYDVIIRQSLVRGNYALIGPDMEPFPDYWLSLLHKKLVGEIVLNVEKGLEENRTVRVYSHCTSTRSGRYNKGAVTIIAMNVHQSEPVSLTLTGSLLGLDVDQYLLTPDDDQVTSPYVSPQSSAVTHPSPLVPSVSYRRVLLNGKLLKVVNDTLLPDLPAEHVPRGKPLVLPPLTFAFYVVPSAQVRACL